MILQDAIDELIETYNSIDVRTFCTLRNNAWNNIFTIIRFRREGTEELKEHHEVIISKCGGLVDTGEFRVGMFQTPIEKWDKVKADLSNRFICLRDNFAVNFSSGVNLDHLDAHPNFPNGRDLVFTDWKSFHNSIDDNRDETFSYRSKLAEEAIKRHFGNFDDYLEEIFEFDKYEFQRRPWIDIFAPVFLGIENIRFDPNKADVTVSAHRQENIEVTFRFLGCRPGQKTHLVDKKTVSMPLDDGNGLQKKTVTVPIDTTKIKEFELLVIKNRKILLVEERHSVSKFWEGSGEFAHPYSAVFAKYVGFDELERMLFEFKSRDGSQSKTFETAVSWMLSVLNLPNIMLGKYEKVGSGVGEISTDMIGMVDKNTVLLANATTGLPRQSDFDRERSFRENMARLIKNKDVELLSVYFTAGDATESFQAASDNSVNLIGKKQMKQILQHIREGEIEKAREVILDGHLSRKPSSAVEI